MSCKALIFLALLTAALPYPAQAQDKIPRERLAISMPGKAWAVEIDSPGFVIESNGPKGDGRQYLLANNSKTGLVLSVTLEEIGGADSTACPDFLKKRVDSVAGLGVENVKASQIGSLAVMQYLLPKPQGVPLKQENFVACTAKDDVYIDIHLSKVLFQPSEEPLFTDVLKRVQVTNQSGASLPNSSRASIAATPASTATSLDYFREGSRYYIANDFGKAIGPFQKALDLEKQQRDLTQDYWRVLVDNLGMAYGVTGDLNRAEETFRYGVSKDPGYPMFYYNLGCTYAERNDMKTAMDFLSKAFALRANSIPGEGMPDPRKDDSFQRFMSNERFRKFLDTLPIASN